MKKTEISNCWTLENTEYDGRQLYTVKTDGFRLIELNNGQWLYSSNDGRYHLEDDENKRFAAVYNNEYDEDGEIVESEFIGFCEV